MPETSSLPEILIIGGGLAGLSLAQGLKQSNIPFRIFERDTCASYRAQGYRIRISADGADALQRLLPEHLWSAFEPTSAELVPGGSMIDASTAEATNMMARGAFQRRTQDMGKAYNVDRAVLRNLLLSGLEEFISFGKRLDRFERCGDDEVVVFFSDGTSARGQLLVGADGIRSVVRRQLLPNLVVLDTEGRAVFGKTAITNELRTLILNEIGRGISLSSKESEPRLRLFCDGMVFNREQSSSFDQQLDLHVPADYIYWVLLFRSDVVSAEVEKSLLSFSSGDSADKSIELIASWHESLQALLKYQDRDAASTLAFLMARLDFGQQWAEKPQELKGLVTLIGDSAHPMPPIGGLGANAGFQDAVALHDVLCKLADGGDEQTREQLISTYEEEMLARTKPMIEQSVGGAGRFFDMRPVAELKEAQIWH